MLTSRRAVGLLSLALVASPGWWDVAAVGRSGSPNPQEFSEVGQGRPDPIDEDLEAFRVQMIQFMQGAEAALGRALEHPAIGERVEVVLAANLLELPFPSGTYSAIEDAGTEDLFRLREVLARSPGFLAIPNILDAAIDQIPADPAERATCGDNYQEWSNVVSKTSVNRGLTIAYDTLGFVYSIFNTITEVAGASTEDTAYIGKIPSIPFIVVRGVLGVVQSAIGFARSDIGYQINLSELCLASCLSDDGDVHGQPSKFLRGRGCDNRDNNCANGIDDAAEDLFPPTISFDAAVIGRCFSDVMAAQAAANLAVKASDDCSTPTTNVTLGAVSAQDCKAPFSVMAQDRSNNASTLSGPLFALTVDGQAPQVTTPPLNACYATMAAARAAFTGPGLSIVDCTDVQTRLDAIEKECVADLGLTVVDACGNQTTVRDTVRVDGVPPEVDIERLLIPAVDGLACFATEADARTAVDESTVVSDNCTLPENLTRSTTVAGDACNLEIRQSVTDECGQMSADALTVRVDAQPPLVSCSIAQPTLYPANGLMVDVGFSYQASDNCEPNGPRLDVEVTSDEPTRYAYSALVGDDPYPDAVVERGPGGSIVRILLRAQRSQTRLADGRVYRIRIVATDSCGLQSHADCYATVPRTNPGPGSAVNSGQEFDATALN